MILGTKRSQSSSPFRSPLEYLNGHTPATPSVKRLTIDVKVKAFLLGMRVTIWEEKRCFSSFEVPLDLTVLTHVSLENEDFVSPRTFL